MISRPCSSSLPTNPHQETRLQELPAQAEISNGYTLKTPSLLSQDKPPPGPGRTAGWVGDPGGTCSSQTDPAVAEQKADRLGRA
jgi:hypothetical protein